MLAGNVWSSRRVIPANITLLDPLCQLVSRGGCIPYNTVFIEQKLANLRLAFLCYFHKVIFASMSKQVHQHLSVHWYRDVVLLWPRIIHQSLRDQILFKISDGPSVILYRVCQCTKSLKLCIPVIVAAGSRMEHTVGNQIC
jgi:hypothetical protein